MNLLIRLIISTLSIVFLYGIFYFGKLIYWLLYSVKLAQKTKGFERIAGKPIILVYGDSVAFGTGASNPEKNFIGLIGKYYPHASIANHATVGFALEQIIRSMKTNSLGDTVVICGGGIDILFLKPVEHIRKDIQKLFKIASEKGKKVIIITPLNLGLSTIFPGLLKKFYLQRSLTVGKIFEEEAKHYKNIFISNNLLIDSAEMLPPWKKISASDRIHPNDAGYAWGFERVRSLL